MFKAPIKNQTAKIFKVTSNTGVFVEVIGYFKAFSLAQIAEYIEERNIKPVDGYNIDSVDLIDVSEWDVKYVVSATRGLRGKIDVTTDKALRAEHELNKLKRSGLSKLTDAEKTALGL